MVEIWNEYISREALRDVIESTNWYHAASCGKLGLGAPCEEIAVYKATDIYKAVDSVPAADVVEVRHGEWAESCSHGVWHYDCPFCGDGYATKERQEKPENYCSNCGARMDGGSR